MQFSNRVVKNATWIILCRVVQSVLNLIVGMLTARYLGPAGNGLIAYAAALVSFAAPMMHLGFRGTLVQELIAQPDREGEIMGTSLGLSLLSSLACIVGVVLFSMVLNPASPETTLICGIYSIVLVFQAVELLHYWFHAKLLSKYPSFFMLLGYGVMAVYKIYLLVSGKSIFWFAISNTVEAVVITLGMVLVYHRLEGAQLRFSFHMGKELFSRSRHYILPAMMVAVFQQCDRIMLKSVLGDTATGLYSAAITCVGVTGFVFAAIIDSAQPVILQKKKENEKQYEKGLSLLYGLIFYMGAAQALCMTVFAKPMIWILFGEAYLDAVPALRIAVWYVIFAYIGSVRNIWIVSQNKQEHMWLVYLSGAVINVVLNGILIPVSGICGAAAATVAAQFVSNVAVGFAMPSIRSNNRLLLEGVNPKSLARIWRLLPLKKQKRT